MGEYQGGRAQNTTLAEFVVGAVSYEDNLAPVIRLAESEPFADKVVVEIRPARIRTLKGAAKKYLGETVQVRILDVGMREDI